MGSDRQNSRPRVLPLERLIEVEDLDEFVTRVRGLAHQQTEVYEREYDITDVGAGANAPVLEDDARHHAKALEGQIAAGEGQLPAADVAAFFHALLAKLQGGEHEELRALVEPRLAEPDAVHDSVPKRQL